MKAERNIITSVAFVAMSVAWILDIFLVGLEIVMFKVYLFEGAALLLALVPIVVSLILPLLAVWLYNKKRYKISLVLSICALVVTAGISFFFPLLLFLVALSNH